MLKVYLANALETNIDNTVIEDITKNISSNDNAVSKDIEKLKPDNILELLHTHMPNILNIFYQILIILIILFISTKIISFLLKLLDKFLRKSKFDIGTKKFLLSLFKVLSYFIVALILASRIGIDSASIFAILGSIGLAIGLAMQGSLSNFAGGVLILISKPFLVGDYIITNMGEGNVSMIGLIYTNITTYDNKKITIPNGTLANSVITNLSANHERMLELKINISYSSDITKVKNILDNIFKSDDKILKNKEFKYFVDSFASSSIVIGTRVWCLSRDFLDTKWRMLEQIKIEFDKNQIEIPFEQIELKIK